MTLPWRSFEGRVGLLAGASAAAAFLVSPLLGWPGAAGIALSALGAAVLGTLVYRWVTRSIARPLRTAANVVDALRQSDFSLRTRVPAPEGPLGDLLRELNALSAHFQAERARAVEATALLGAIVERMDVALLAFTDAGALVTMNPAADRLFPGKGAGATAASMGVADWLDGPSERAVTVPGQSGEGWDLRRGAFWQGGQRHLFLLVADARRTRRAQERVAWQRLVRVISHEVNNSLSPIQSLAGTCREMVRESPVESAPDVAEALGMIAQRAEGLGRFITEFARLARLPPPTMGLVRLHECLRAAAALAPSPTVRLDAGPEVTLQADGAQLEQAFVNLVKNAVEAAGQTSGSVALSWTCREEGVVVTIVDDGPGIENPDNLFVPFFSTKPEGSGIGLALSRNIIEAHGGAITIANRREGRGCVVRVALPLSQEDEAPLSLL
jgi:nitrogen fixation/metabolism regulation signal transduction histidine kinase